MTQPEVLYMTHPDSSGVAPTSREAFDGLWQGKGWRLVDEHAAAAAALTDGQVTDLARLTVAELTDLATDRGVALPDGARKADLIAALEDAAPTA